MEIDPFQFCQTFPQQLDGRNPNSCYFRIHFRSVHLEFAVEHMNGLNEKAPAKFIEFCGLDNMTDLQGRPVIKRERLLKLSASEMHFALLCQRPPFEITEIIERAPHLVDIPDRKGHTPLHLAASSGHEEITKILLEAGASVNARTNVQNTPLHMCFNKPQIVKLLLEAGAVVEVSCPNISK